MRELTNAELDAEVIALDARRKEPRIKLVPFDRIQLGADRRYLVKGIIPYPGLSVIWGPPKSGKSFWVFDLVMRVALGWGLSRKAGPPGTGCLLLLGRPNRHQGACRSFQAEVFG